MLNARILISKETVKELVQALHRAYKAGDTKMVRRISALLSISRGEKVGDIAATLGIAPSSVYASLSFSPVSFSTRGLPASSTPRATRLFSLMYWNKPRLPCS